LLVGPPDTRPIREIVRIWGRTFPERVECSRPDWDRPDGVSAKSRRRERIVRAPSAWTLLRTAARLAKDEQCADGGAISRVDPRRAVEHSTRSGNVRVSRSGRVLGEWRRGSLPCGW